MARTCTVCTHPKREEIDAALVAQVSIRDIAGQTGTKKSAIDRHRKHLSSVLVKAEEAKETARAGSLLDTIQGLAADAHRIKAKAEEAEDLRTALDAIGKLTKIVELLAKLRDEIRDEQQPLAFIVTMTDGRMISTAAETVPPTSYSMSAPLPPPGGPSSAPAPEPSSRARTSARRTRPLAPAGPEVRPSRPFPLPRGPRRGGYQPPDIAGI